MILIILGVIVGIIVFPVEKHAKTNTLSNLLIISSITLIMLGLIMPIAGYNEPVLVDSQPLQSVNHVIKDQDYSDDVYLVYNVGSFWKSSSYSYCIKTDGEYEKQKLYRGISISYEDIDSPVIETYEERPIPTLFSFNLLGANRHQIIKINQDMVRLSF